MALQIGDTAPDFEAETTEGRIGFHDWIGDSWAVLFSHPKDFTPVCTTELGYMAKIKPDFDTQQRQDHRAVRRSGREPRAVVGRHRGDARACAELSDDRRRRLQRVEALRDARRRRLGRSAATARRPTTRRCATCSWSAPTRRSSSILVYPMTTGRNFDEVLRVIDSLQLTASTRSRPRSTGSRATT